VSRSGDIELSVIRDSPRHRWSPRGELVASVGSTFKVYQTHVGLESQSSQEPLHNQQDEGKSPFKGLSNLHQDTELTTAPGNQNLAVHTNVPRKYSPSSILRMPLEKKTGPESAISTPRPLAVTLDSEESTLPKMEAASASRPALSKQTNQSRGRSAGRSEKRNLERYLAQDISTIIRRRVEERYGLLSVSTSEAPYFIYLLYARLNTTLRSSKMRLVQATHSLKSGYGCIVRNTLRNYYTLIHIQRPIKFYKRRMRCRIFMDLTLLSKEFGQFGKGSDP
jgi:hypothetical protein